MRWRTEAGVSDIIPLQHFGDVRVKLFAPTHFFKPFQQILGPNARPLRPLQIMQHPAAMHHHNPVPEVDGLLHRMRHHQRREFVAFDNLVSQPDDLIRALGVKGGGVFVEQE